MTENKKVVRNKSKSQEYYEKLYILKPCQTSAPILGHAPPAGVGSHSEGKPAALAETFASSRLGFQCLTWGLFMWMDLCFSRGHSPVRVRLSTGASCQDWSSHPIMTFPCSRPSASASLSGRSVFGTNSRGRLLWQRGEEGGGRGEAYRCGSVVMPVAGDLPKEQQRSCRVGKKRSTRRGLVLPTAEIICWLLSNNPW